MYDSKLASKPNASAFFLAGLASVDSPAAVPVSFPASLLLFVFLGLLVSLAPPPAFMPVLFPPSLLLFFLLWLSSSLALSPLLVLMAHSIFLS